MRPPDELLADRTRTLSRIADLAGEWDAIVAAMAGTATDDEHDAEGATIGFERARVRALLDDARRHLAGVDAAIARHGAGSYGRCRRCGEPIGSERLEALPTVTTCVACAAQR